MGHCTIFLFLDPDKQFIKIKFSGRAYRFPSQLGKAMSHYLSHFPICSLETWCRSTEVGVML
ncbi:hypothetical protein HanHA300_Chr15g0575811 [Helianthus annuus]|nr:hypothetical protein HanHA300_Chr15g0575811 [Helianthus annuus]KAJ0474066.1 hypothetical protein HanHA89_Chr15g0625531 [Helianthus annuus]KAJ0649630.1 hypothetical protein HanLR1_Chr15g0586521 [Helianthus annuus]